ncbi:MAG: MFS transporter [Actinomycetes bacterium]
MDQATVHHNRWRILAVLVVSLLVVVLDNTILNVALPTISTELQASHSQLIWAVDSYALVFASLLFTWGVLGDRFGRRRVLIIGIVLFGLASLLTAYASSPEQLIVFRAVMGVGGAAVLPVTLAIITNVFPPNERGRAIGVWAGAVGVAVAIGPITGGFLLEHFWWGSVFLINVPVVIAGVIGIVTLVPESMGDSTRRLDPPGIALSITGLLLLVFGIVHGGETRDWSSPSVWGPMLAGVAILTLFFWLELRSDHPSLDVHLFSNREFTSTLAAVTLAFFGLMGATFFLVFYLQTVRGLTPFQAGLALLPLALGQVVSATRSASTSRRFGPRLVIGTGLTIVGLVFVAMVGVQVDTPMWAILLLYLGIGIGMGNAIAPATTVMMSTLPLSRAGAGSAVQNTVRQVGGALGVAILGTVVAVVYGSSFDKKLPDLPAAAASASNSVEQAHAVATQGLAMGVVSPAQADALITAANDAFMNALHVATLFTAVAAFVGAGVAFYGLPRKEAAAAIQRDRQQQFEDFVPQPDAETA